MSELATSGVSELIDRAKYAHWAEQYPMAVGMFAEVIMEVGGVEPPDNCVRNFSAEYTDGGTITCQVVRVAEIAMPLNMIGRRVQRVRVSQVLAGDDQTPAFWIDQQYPLGGVHMLQIPDETKPTLVTGAYGKVHRIEDRQVHEPRIVCAEMSLAAFHGTPVDRDQLGNKSPKERRQTRVAKARIVGQEFVRAYNRIYDEYYGGM
ncbi:MAG TPA: hypothetical protein VLG47_05040 [Candidatus Saccharimonadales bacterium]|nr:hypothetical protein [Candidatus Saccharimonadales bacterium]